MDTPPTYPPQSEGTQEEVPYNHTGEQEAESYMATSLRVLCQKQIDLWRKDRGVEGFAGNTEEVRTISFALVAEILELANELGWKSWKPRQVIDRERVVDEWADCLAFLGTLTAYIISQVGVYPEELIRAYFVKLRENHRRFDIREWNSEVPQDVGTPG
jgi:NTP pyrophosphatase (non-canonical NTP hydrolase)